MSVVANTNPEDRVDVAQAVYREVQRVLPEKLVADLTPETNLYEAGLDSLQQMDVVNALERAFRMRFKEEWLYDIETCGDLVQLIETCLSGNTAQLPQTSKGDSPELVPREIEDAFFQVDKFPECVAFQQRLDGAAFMGLEVPFFRVNEATHQATSTINGREIVRYTSYNYLGCSGTPQVTTAATEAIQRFGTSASASRLVGGDYTVVEDLDREIAEFLGTEAAVVFHSGYDTNASVISHLMDEEDLILYDELAHNSLAAGINASGARRRPFPHNNYQFVDDLLADTRTLYRRVLIVVEGVYSMDGDFPQLPKFLEVKCRHKSLIYVDEAHSFGVMGATGRGISEHFGIDPNEGDIWMGTLSKSLGSAGGFVAGRRALIKYLKYNTPGFVFSAAITPGNSSAALASLRLLKAEPQRVETLRQRGALFLQLVKAAELDTGDSGGTPIIPIIIGDSARCLRISKALLDAGIDAQPILYPAVAEKASRIRFFITANHTEQQIRQTVAVLVKCMQEV